MSQQDKSGARDGAKEQLGIIARLRAEILTQAAVLAEQLRELVPESLHQMLQRRSRFLEDITEKGRHELKRGFYEGGNVSETYGLTYDEMMVAFAELQKAWCGLVQVEYGSDDTIGDKGIKATFTLLVPKRTPDPE